MGSVVSLEARVVEAFDTVTEKQMHFDEWLEVNKEEMKSVEAEMQGVVDERK